MADAAPAGRAPAGGSGGAAAGGGGPAGLAPAPSADDGPFPRGSFQYVLHAEKKAGVAARQRCGVDRRRRRGGCRRGTRAGCRRRGGGPAAPLRRHICPLPGGSGARRPRVEGLRGDSRDDHTGWHPPRASPTKYWAATAPRAATADRPGAAFRAVSVGVTGSAPMRWGATGAATPHADHRVYHDDGRGPNQHLAGWKRPPRILTRIRQRELVRSGVTYDC